MTRVLGRCSSSTQQPLLRTCVSEVLNYVLIVLEIKDKALFKFIMMRQKNKSYNAIHYSTNNNCCLRNEICVSLSFQFSNFYANNFHQHSTVGLENPRRVKHSIVDAMIIVLKAPMSPVYA